MDCANMPTIVPGGSARAQSIFPITIRHNVTQGPDAPVS